MNPLLMEDILDDLFKKLTIEDLKICRSVCQLWNKRVVAHLKLFWRDLPIIELYTEYVTQSFLAAMYESKDKKIFTSFDGSITKISKLGSKFIIDYEPKRLDLHIESLNKVTKLQNLINVLKLASKNLVQLGIDGSTSNLVGLTKNEDDKKWLNLTFPNLEMINFNIKQDIRENPIICEQFIQIIQEIVKNSPNLKSIENPGMNFSICSSKIMSSEMLKKLTKLTISIEVYVQYIVFRESFEIENRGTCQDLIKMQNEGLKLKYLDITFSVDDGFGEIDKKKIQNDITAIEKFLEGQSGSLETLKIRIKHDYQMKIYSIFPKLKNLVLGIFHSSLKTQLNLSSQFPQLEALCLNIYCKKIVKWNKLFCGSGLKVHTIGLCNNGSDGEYRDLEMLFPHVVNLRIRHPRKNSLKYERFGKFWSKSIKSISIVANQEKIKKFVHFDLKFFKIFNGLQRIDFKNGRSYIDSQSADYWKTDFKLLESLKNLKFVKMDNLLVNHSDLTELRKKYILDYIPGKFRNYAVILGLREN